MFPENFPAYIVEGLLMGLVLSSMTTTIGYISESLTGRDDDQRVLWVMNLLITMIVYIIGESFRHTRIAALMKSLPKIPSTPSLVDIVTTLRRNAYKPLGDLGTTLRRNAYKPLGDLGTALRRNA